MALFAAWGRTSACTFAVILTCLCLLTAILNGVMGGRFNAQGAAICVLFGGAAILLCLSRLAFSGAKGGKP